MRKFGFHRSSFAITLLAAAILWSLVATSHAGNVPDPTIGGFSEIGTDGPMIGIRFETGLWNLTFAAEPDVMIRVQTQTAQ